MERAGENKSAQAYNSWIIKKVSHRYHRWTRDIAELAPLKGNVVFYLKILTALYKHHKGAWATLENEIPPKVWAHMGASIKAEYMNARREVCRQNKRGEWVPK